MESTKDRHRLNSHNPSLDNWLRFLIVAVLVIGILFRFANLDRKFYWVDETYTSLRVSGYTEAEMLKEISYQKITSPSDLQKYQQINSEKTVRDTLNSLATEDPQHPPLYYVLARYWAQWFGSSVAAMRSLVAVISLLVFPAIYWLAWELFESSAVAWMAIAIFAISPYHILFAQEARQYSLWTVTTILSTAALLRAMRATDANQNPIWLVYHWTIYAVMTTMGFYTHLLFVCVAAAHAIYVAVIANWRDIKTFIAYYVAALIALIGFRPSLINTVENFPQIRSTTAWLEQTNFLRLVSRWVGSVSIAFFDIGIDGTANATQLALLIPVGMMILALVGYALYYLCRQTPKRVWLIVWLLIATTALFLAVPDIIKGGRRSANPRYLVPCYVGIQLAVAYLLYAKISNYLDNLKQQKLWKIIIVAVFSAGIISGGVSSQADIWWNKGSGWLRTLEVATTINQASNPLIISDTNIVYLMPLSYYLQPKVKLLIEPRCYTSCYKNRELAKKKPQPPQIPGVFTELFLYRPSKALRSAIQQQNYQIDPADTNVELNLWKITTK
ncbi:glycosyltransferase family 39 protein [Microcoleus sp. Pol11C3]|uniref:glycosyltransferase family 39 protein n=1 Tax=Microcoleus sp. Pol11C3 TaxID=3055390 RepID=UPI002FD7641F